MINKDICKKCFDKYKNWIQDEWGKEQEENWKKGEVLCPSELTGFGIVTYTISNGVHCYCPYRLEHLLK
jgi:hypothetical protein